MSPEKAFLQFRDATEQYSMLKQVIHWQESAGRFIAPSAKQVYISSEFWAGRRRTRVTTLCGAGLHVI